MKLTITSASALLGRPMPQVLTQQPFVDWASDRSVDSDLDPVRINYVFRGRGVDVVCDELDTICSLFLYSRDGGRTELEIADLSFDLDRSQVLALLGPPSESGPPLSHPVLGPYGPWDRFRRPEYALHVQFRADADRISMITFIRNDVVP